MSNLFVQAQSTGAKPLVTFRAGRMYKEGGKVKPDPRKGQVSLTQSTDGLIHFQWTDRRNGNMEDDLIIFPEEAELKRVEKCTTGRVYVLAFKNSNRELFYWVQEPKDDKDKENCENVNKYIKTPPPPPAAGGAGMGGDAAGAGAGGMPGMPAGLAGMGREDLMGLLANMQGQPGGAEMMQALMGRGRGGGDGGRGGGRGQGAPPAAAAGGGRGTAAATQGTGGATGGSGTGAAGIDVGMLQNILSGLGAAPPQQRVEHTMDLGHVLDSSEVAKIVENDAESFVNELKDQLPDAPSNQTQQEALVDTLRSAQFQQSCDLFQAALSDPDAYNEIVTGFELQRPTNNSGPPFGVEAFVDLIQSNYPPKKSGDTSSAMDTDKEKEDKDSKKDESSDAK